MGLLTYSQEQDDPTINYIGQSLTEIHSSNNKTRNNVSLDILSTNGLETGNHLCSDDDSAIQTASSDSDAESENDEADETEFDETDESEAEDSYYLSLFTPSSSGK